MKKLTPKEQDKVREIGGWVREVAKDIQKQIDKLGEGYSEATAYQRGQRDMAMFVSSLFDPQAKEGLDILEGILDTIPSLSEIVLPGIRAQAKIMMAAEDKVRQILKVLKSSEGEE